MKRILLYSILFFSNIQANYSQTTFEGNYTCNFNQDAIRLMLSKSEINRYTGKMEDSQQKYILNAELIDGELLGTASELDFGITFKIRISFQLDKLKLNLILDGPESNENVELFFERETISKNKTENLVDPLIGSKPVFQFPKEATHDLALIGIWVKEQLYNSGSGENFMGATHKETIIFFENGSVGDGGTQTTLSGSDFLGQSQSGYKAIPNVFWYTINNQIYFASIENNKTETAHLGRYFIENGALLITASNGEKSLLKKN